MTLTDKRIEWKARIDAWKVSGLSVAEWCREQGVKDHQMYYWIQKYEHDTRPIEQEISASQWLTVKVDDEPTSTAGQEPVLIHFGSISVEVRPGSDMSLLSDVIQVLQKPC